MQDKSEVYEERKQHKCMWEKKKNKTTNLPLTSCDGSFLAHGDGDSSGRDHYPPCWETDRHLESKLTALCYFMHAR